MVSQRRPKRSLKSRSASSEKRLPTPAGAESRQNSLDARTRRSVVLASFLLLLTIYLVWFYRLELAQGIGRVQALALVLVPDQIVIDGWFGGQVGQFHIVDRIPLFAVAVAIWGTAFLLGRVLLVAGHVDTLLSRLELFLFAMGVGLSGLSLYTLAVGLCGGLRQPMLFAVPAGLIVAVAVIQWRVSRTGCDPADRVPAQRPAGLASWWRPQWWWLGVPFVAVILLSAALPPSAFDVLEYHLQVPKQWYQQGQVTFLPHNIYGNMPLGAEMLALLAMVLMPGELNWWWGALAGKVVLAGFAPLTALMLYAAGRRFASRRAGVVAALLCISTAWIAFVSMQGMIDGVLAFYLLASLYAFRLWWDAEHNRNGTCRWSWVLLAGFMAGTAIACKYTAVLFVAIPLLAGFLWAGNRLGLSRRAVLHTTTVFLLALGLGCGLWLGKNWVMTGNPTYPLLYQAFGGRTRTPEKDQQWRTAHQVPRDQHGKRYSLSQASDALLNVLGRSRWHHPLIIPLAFLVVCRRRRLRQAIFWIGGIVYILLAWWLFTHRIDRFWVPALPLMALVAGIGATWSAAQLWRRTLWSILVASLVVNFLLIASPFSGQNHLFVSLVQLRDDPEISLTLPAHLHLNEWLDQSTRVLLVGDAAAFDLRMPVLYSTCFDDCVFEQIFRDRDGRERRARLRELGVTHLFVDWSEIQRYRDTYGFSDYVTPQLVYDELVREQQILRRVPMPLLDRMEGELFEVVKPSGNDG